MSRRSIFSTPSIWQRLIGMVAAIALQATMSIPADAADIYGTIFYQGTPPAEIPITPLKNDPNCGPLYKVMPTTHFYRVGADHRFGDVVVALLGITGKSTGARMAPLIIDQRGCQYTPYIAACQTGQKIIVRNSDPVMHNVHTTPKVPGNKEFNVVQMPHSPDVTLQFNEPEDFLRFKCDVHPWMFAYVSVFDHPWFSVSASDGAYRIHDVPPGRYTVIAMHRKAGSLKKTVDVTKEDVQLDFTFAGGNHA